MGCQDVREEFLPKLGIHFSKDVKRIAFPLQTPEDWDQIKLEWNNEVLRPKKKDILLAELRVNEMVCFIYSTSIIVVYSSIIYWQFLEKVHLGKKLCKAKNKELVGKKKSGAQNDKAANRAQALNMFIGSDQEDQEKSIADDYLGYNVDTKESRMHC